MARAVRFFQDREEIEGVLRKTRVCRLALHDGEYPYVIPVVFGYREGRLIIHSAPSGKKIELIRSNPNVAFEMDTDIEMVIGKDVCSWGMRYRSVVGRGKARLVEDPRRKEELLRLMVAHSTGHEPETLPRGLAEVAVIEVSIEEMTGRESVRA